MGGRIAWLTAAILALVPGTALAATAASVYPRGFPGTPAFLYSAAAGEANRVSLVAALPAPETVLVRETGPGVALHADTCAPVPAGALCTSLVHRHEASGLAGVSALPWGYARVELRDGGDRLETRGFRVADGLDVLAGGGDDALDLDDGARQFAHCGAGFDTVLADAADVVDQSCERVAR